MNIISVQEDVLKNTVFLTESVDFVFRDVNRNCIAFGGQHEVFTRGCAKSRISARNLQVLLTQQALAYMRSHPYKFSRTNIRYKSLNQPHVTDHLFNEQVTKVTTP